MSNRRPFHCNACPKTFTRSENLERHKRSRHGGETRRTFICPHCQAGFSRSDVCKRHVDRCAQSPPCQREGQTIPDDSLFASETLVASLGVPVSRGSSSGSRFAQENIPEHDLNDESAEQHIAAYFRYFHPALPLVHRPTFHVSSASRLLVNIMSIIGRLYLVPRPLDDTTEELWHQGVAELSQHASDDWRALRNPWVMQTWLLHMVYGAYMGEVTQSEKTRQMLRSLVDAVRDLGLLRQVVATSTSPTWQNATIANAAQAESLQLHEQWKSFVDEESLKLSIYTLLLLDHHVLSCCNMRPLLSPIEVGWELPLATSLWEAENAEAWQQTLYDEYGRATTSPLETTLHIPISPSTMSLSVATQFLMSEAPDADLITALSKSPVATMSILTNLDVLVRDFTRCYYQLPPNPSDPSAFHILTQSQNRQINTALLAISGVLKERMANFVSESDQASWHACQILAWSVKLSLCRPDDLLLGGIVENRVFASLVTATHLTLGSYFSIKRATQGLMRPVARDDEMIEVADELTTALSSISGLSTELAVWEAPWITAASYRILLKVWRTLRVTVASTREKVEKSCTQGLSSCSLGPSWVVFNLAMEAVLQHDQSPDTPRKQARLWTVDRRNLVALLDDSETTLMDLIVRVCRSRHVWAIGPSMATIVEEIIATNSSSHS